MKALREALSASSYPGRGIVLGLDEKGTHAVLMYFIMGRSDNSRNRVFVEEEMKLFTRPYDQDKVEDPSLIIYTPVRTIGCDTIVSNGDQTDTIHKEIVKRQAQKAEQLSFHQSVHMFDKALRRREFEPDAPNFTPRISGLAHIREGEYGYALNILKADGATRPACLRQTFTYEVPRKGQGHFIHTYQGDGSPLPSFTGEPECVAITGDIDEITDAAWEALDQDNRVSLYVRLTDLKNSRTKSRVVNANK
ncbi:MAG: IMP cyclohydrolase [Lachnospiraceae bacterium]|nr:IMP cyclohydrolase [Lachnospiraceae bacterium]